MLSGQRFTIVVFSLHGGLAMGGRVLSGRGLLSFVVHPIGLIPFGIVAYIRVRIRRMFITSPRVLVLVT